MVNNKNYFSASFSFYPKRIVRISATVFDSLNYPLYIRLLVNSDKMQVAVQACSKEEKRAVKVKYGTKSQATHGKYINSRFLLEEVYQMANWDKNITYRIKGTKVDDQIIVFNIADAKTTHRSVAFKKQDEESKKED